MLVGHSPPRFVLPDAVVEYLGKCKVVSEIVELTGWKCAACSRVCSKSMARCKCGGAKPSDTPPGHTQLVRMPSDLDPAFFVPPTQEKAALENLKSVQRAAVDFVVSQARRLSNEQRDPLLRRVQGMGYSEREMRRCLNFLRDEAPIIIHVSMKKALKFLVEDTHCSCPLVSTLFIPACSGTLFITGVITVSSQTEISLKRGLRVGL